ncbi:MAG TPA: extracellular solute-binding protein [Anaerolineae bacterium]|nr:extracellular solute-binding protein [Anaerolineae bacterium]HPL29137.1 extracellular solute-binding protein [Anaerolineae bacterium]
MSRQRRGRFFILCLVAFLGLAIRKQVSLPAPASLSRVAPPSQAAARGQAGQAAEKVSILGPWAGPDSESFWAVVRLFAQRSGLNVAVESTPDVARILAGRLEEGAVPDIAILSNVALVQRYARAGCLVPLRRVLDVERLAASYPAGWLDLVSVDGEPYGLLYHATNESIVWYRPAEFQRRRWTIPATWSDLVTLSGHIAGQGLAPWSVGLKGRALDGAAGTAWIENLLLRNAGPDAYDRWVRHELPWTDPAVRQAFLAWGQIVGRPRQLTGGVARALASDSAEAALRLYQELPEAYLCLGGSAIQPFIAQHFPQQAAGEDYDFFALPTANAGDGATVVAGADVLVLLSDAPQAGRLLAHLASDEAQAAWAQRGGFVALSGEVRADAYADTLSRRAAGQMLNAETLRFDASAQMPPEVEQAFCRAACDFAANPGRLEAILGEVEAVARQAYPQRRETPAAPAAAGEGRSFLP